MTKPQVFAYQDLLEAMDDFVQALGASSKQSQNRRAIEEAYREVAGSHDWSFLHVTGRVLVKAPQGTGTVTFDYTGGEYERMLQLEGATWPDWVENACIRFNDTVCDVELMKSSTVVTLDAQMCPLENVEATTYSLFPRWYILPSDFVSMDRPMDASNAWKLGEVRSISEILELLHNDTSTGDTDYYAVGPAPDLYGSMALYIWPPSDATEALTFPYKRRPRELRYSGLDIGTDAAGTVSVTAGDNEVTGSGSAFDVEMAGSLLRIGSSTTRLPTGIVGGTRYAEQRVIHRAPTATRILLDTTVETTRDNVRYTITDPLDVDVAAYDAVVACARRNLVREKTPKLYPIYQDAYAKALARAKGDDYRITQRRVCGTPNTTYYRLADASSRPEI